MIRLMKAIVTGVIVTGLMMGLSACEMPVVSDQYTLGLGLSKVMYEMITDERTQTLDNLKMLNKEIGVDLKDIVITKISDGDARITIGKYTIYEHVEIVGTDKLFKDTKDIRLKGKCLTECQNDTQSIHEIIKCLEIMEGFELKSQSVEAQLKCLSKEKESTEIKLSDETVLNATLKDNTINITIDMNTKLRDIK